MPSVPLGAHSQGAAACCEVFIPALSHFGCLAALPEDLMVTMSAPDGRPGPIEGELPVFLKATSLAVLGVLCPEKLFVGS